MKKKSKKIEILIKQANIADVIWYTRQLIAMKDAMYKDYVHHIKQFYKINESYLVKDLDPIEQLQELIDAMGEKWFSIFHQNSFRLARNAMMRIKRDTQKKFNDIYKKHTEKLNPPPRNIFTIEAPESFEQPTELIKITSIAPKSLLKQPPLQSFYQQAIPEFNKTFVKNPFIIQPNMKERNAQIRIIEAGIAENVGLIKSIPRQVHEQIQGSVMRNVAVGGNAKKLFDELTKISDRSSKRIKFITNDQIAKATALMDQQEAMDLGFTKAIWKKSIAGKTHRPDHAAADGKEFDIKKGCLIEGEYILPRMKINCKCSYKLVIK